MALRLIQRGKNRNWYVDDRLDGLRIRDCLGTSDKRLAERKATEIEADVIAGLYKLSKNSFQHCVDIYKREILSRKSKSCQVGYEVILRKHLLPVFNGMSVKEVVCCDPMSGNSPFKTFFVDRSSLPKSSLTKMLVVFRDVILIAFPEFKVPKIDFPNKGFYQKRFISESDLDIFLQPFKEDYRDLAIVMAYTGLRFSDALNLTWSKINLKSKMVSVVMGKTGGNVRIPISPKVLQVFIKRSKVRFIDDDRLFFFKACSFRKAWVALRKDTKFSWLRPHDLRHFFCSYLLNSGVDHMTVATLSGHKSVEILKNRYGHIQDETLKKAMRVFDNVPSSSTKA